MAERHLLFSQDQLQQACNLSRGPSSTTILLEELCIPLWIAARLLKSSLVKWIKVRSNSLVNVGVRVVGKNVVLSPEDLHSLLGVFLQLKYN